MKITKDCKKRSQYQNFEIQQKLVKSLLFNCNLTSLTRRKLSWQLNRLSNKNSLVFIKNICVFSGRARSVYKFFNLSRLCIKQFFKEKLLPNFTKSSW